MRLLDPIIIYLAVGAPVAMYRSFQAPLLWNTRQIARIALTLLFWPIEAYRIAVDQFGKGFATYSFGTREYLDARIQARVEGLQNNIKAAVGSHGISRPAALDEPLDRYIGLSLAAAVEPGAGRRERKLFAAAGHPMESVAAACLARRNRARIERHIAKARADVRAELGRLDEPQFLKVRTLFVGAAICLGDRMFADEIATAAGGREGFEEVPFIDKEVPLWKTEQDKRLPETESSRARSIAAS